MLGSGGGNKKIFKNFKTYFLQEILHSGGGRQIQCFHLSDTTCVDVILNISWGEFLLFFLKAIVFISQTSFY